MNPTIVDEFFTEDCNLSIQQMLIEAIKNYLGQSVVREYTFNRFNVRIFFKDNKVLIEDELMISEEGECEISLSEFEERLRKNIR
ncbi:MAG: hypothetical protein JRJ44_09470 [Deltaproteobacteria bacterium]|nr:hypothetical protein [Deltaproteobacteria bacterium]